LWDGDVEKLYSGKDLSSQGEIAVLRLSSIYGYVPLICPLPEGVKEVLGDP